MLKIKLNDGVLAVLISAIFLIFALINKFKIIFMLIYVFKLVLYGHQYNLLLMILLLSSHLTLYFS